MKKKDTDQKKRTDRMKASGAGINKPPVIKNITAPEIRRLIEDLYSHRAELEAQNEELRVMQSDLESARDKYQDLFDLSPVAYFTLNMDDLIQDVNLTGSLQLGIERSKLIGIGFKNLIHRDDQDSYYLNRRKVFENREQQAFELRILKKDLTPMDARIEAMAVRGATDEISQIRMSVSDITRHEKVEEDLRESERRFRILFSEAAEGIMVADAETHLMRYANKAICALFGYTNDEMIRLSVADLHPAPSRQRALKAFEEMRIGSMDVIKDLPCLCKDGTVFYADIRSVQLNIDRRLCLAGYFTDITARKMADEEEKRRIEELRAANRELARFNRVAVNREIRMIELKKEVNDLCAALGRPLRYNLDFDKEAL